MLKERRSYLLGMKYEVVFYLFLMMNDDDEWGISFCRLFLYGVFF